MNRPLVYSNGHPALAVKVKAAAGTITIAMRISVAISRNAYSTATWVNPEATG